MSHGHSIINSCFAVSVGTLTVTERMTTPVEPVHDAFVTFALDKPLLSSEQAKRLNPLVIEVRSATNLPSTPVSFEELRQRLAQFLTAFLKKVLRVK